MPHMMTTILTTEPSTMNEVAVTSFWSHNPEYEMLQPTKHDSESAMLVFFLYLTAWYKLCHSCGLKMASRSKLKSPPSPLLRIIRPGLLTSTLRTASRCRCTIRSAHAAKRLTSRKSSPIAEK